MAVTNAKKKLNPLAPTAGSVGAFQEMFSAPASCNQAGDQLNQFTKSFKEAVEKTNSPAISAYRVIPVDTASVNGAVQMVALYSKQNDVVSFYTFILEATLASELEPHVYPANNGQPETIIPTVVSELYTQELSQFVSGRIQERESIPASDIHDAGALVIGTAIDPVVDAQNIHVMLWRAANAVQSVFDDADESKPRLCLHTFKDLSFTGRIDFNPGQGQTSSNAPVRRDVALSVTASDGNATAGPNSLTRNTIQMARIGAYLDLRYVGPSNAPQAYGMAPMIDPARVYAPILNIVDTNTLANQINLELQLFGLGEFIHLSTGNSWMNMLRANFGGQNPEIAKLRNIAGLRHELGDLIKDPEAADFNLMEALTAVTYPNLIHVLHTSAASDLSWIHTYFRLAAQGDRLAEETIKTACDNLTNGNFSTFFPADGKIASLDGDRVINGWYNSGTETRDLRDLDYLAMLNLFGETDMPLVESFGDTYLAKNGPIEVRIARRIEIIRKVFDGNCVITDISVPVILTGEFMTSLSRGIQATGVNVNYTDHFAMVQGNDRANLGLLQYAVDATQVPMLNQNMYGTGMMGMQNLYHGNRTIG